MRRIVLKEINNLRGKRYAIIKVFDPTDENIISEWSNLFHSEWTYSFHDDKPKLNNPELFEWVCSFSKRTAKMIKAKVRKKPKKSVNTLVNWLNIFKK